MVSDSIILWLGKGKSALFEIWGIWIKCRKFKPNPNHNDNNQLESKQPLLDHITLLKYMKDV